MNKIRYPYLLIILVAFLAACNSTSSTDETPTPSNLPKSELLAGTVSKSWETTSIKVNGLEIFTESRPCSKDDILVFTVAKAYERNDGPTKCRTNDPQVYEKGKWDLSTDQLQLILNGTSKYKLVELSPKTLKISIRNAFGEAEEQTFRAQ